MAIDMATANGVNQIFTVFVENMEGKGFTQRKYWNKEEGASPDRRLSPGPPDGTGYFTAARKRRSRA